MRKLTLFFRLPGRDRWLLVQAFPLLWFVRLGLWCLPFRILRRYLERLSRTVPKAKAPVPVARIAWAVQRASSLVPDPTCLTRALAAQVLFARYRHAAELRIGVARGEAGVEAHAWIEHDGRVVLGNLRDLSRYTPLL